MPIKGIAVAVGSWSLLVAYGAALPTVWNLFAMVKPDWCAAATFWIAAIGLAIGLLIFSTVSSVEAEAVDRELTKLLERKPGKPRIWRKVS